jgi:WxL domain surface cell wall-binding
MRGTTHSKPTLTRRARQGASTALIGVIAIIAVTGVPAYATTGTATISAGSLAFVTAAPNVSFSATLNGTDQSVTSAQALDVSDATGSGAGWDITATSTTFTSGAKLLATSATTLTGAPTTACDAGATCTLATNSITYPYMLPAATTAPTATKMFNAALNTGIGNETVTPTWHLAVPAATLAGTYTSTWTLSLVSGP